ncbi:hypothetical protein N5923_19615 [Erwiniaceae bacterium BAC15a-03b]|uniref:FERM domain-containing protein n=1 Tax=Winslowiella arboricola TaxID=2978220 RepID=A0A9J6PXX5_9GAMM|nr:hypothetical protein [Winslowiella arboricola]MCU5775450.1 hypothetical protein [Winslowiella arboricola]MCU5779700.1 hypothetical protein [Winslowiella arboricola]
MKTLVPENSERISEMIAESREAGHKRITGLTREERRANFLRDTWGLDENGWH